MPCPIMHNVEMKSRKANLAAYHLLHVEQLILLLIILIASTDFIEAQSGGTIAGRVTLNGNPMAGFSVVLQQQQEQRSGIPTGKSINQLTVETDQDGRFRFESLQAGRYEVRPLESVYVQENARTVTISDGGGVDSIDFALSKAGVITGRVFKENGKPVVMEQVSLVRFDQSGKKLTVRPESSLQSAVVTDDRGIYRAYGLPAGRYMVSVGNNGGGSGLFVRRELNVRTFHPGVTGEDQATIVTVKAGEEASDVDIKIGSNRSSYKITGHFLDAKSRAPVAGILPQYVYLDHGKDGAAIGSINGIGVASNADGQFKLEGLAPGRYRISGLLDPTGKNQSFSEPKNVDIINADLIGVDLIINRGTTISGMAVVEGATKPGNLDLQIMAVSSAGFSLSRIGADGSFQFQGLKPGKIKISVPDIIGPSNFQIYRIERGGVVQEGLVDLSPGEQITDLRVILAYAGGVVRGRIKIEGGEFPMEKIAIIAYLSEPGKDKPRRVKAVQPDATGNFLIEGLLPGEYQLVATAALEQGSTTHQPGTITASQTISVTNDSPSETVITINLTNRK